MINETQAKLRISAKDKTRVAFASVNKRMQGLSKSLFSLKGAFAVLGAVKVTQIFVKQEKAMFQLQARIKSTGGAAGFTATQLDAMAQSMQKVTTYGDEATMEMQSMLLTFTQIRGQEFIGAQEAILNVATAMGTDLKSAAVQVGKALNDPILGVSALARSGIQFSEDQKKMIKSLVDTGKHANAQRIILKELEVQFGGSARAAAQGMGGALSQLGNAFGDMLETLAKITIGEGAGFIRWLTKSVNYINTTVLPAFSFFIEKLGIMKRSISSLTEEETQVRMAALTEQLTTINEKIKSSTDPSVISTYRDKVTGLVKEYSELNAALDKHIAKNKEINSTNNVTGDTGRNVKAYDNQAFISGLQQRLDALNASLFTEQETIAASEENKKWILEDSYQNQLISFSEFQSKKTAVEKQATMDRVSFAEKYNQLILNMQFKNGSQIVGLLQVFAGKNKSIAIAALALEKGLAIARTVINTRAAAARAVAELGYVAGTAAAASIQAQGAISVGIIAATGIGQASQISDGGASPGTASNPYNVNQVPNFGNSQQEQPRNKATINIYGAITKDMIRDVVVPVIQNDLENHDLVLFTDQSRQANL